ncbi:MAG TPA: histidine kinase [Gemmatimonadaceae bacterium]|nr:histidine kinase [Gemmatimonadaceae bacterium]
MIQLTVAGSDSELHHSRVIQRRATANTSNPYHPVAIWVVIAIAAVGIGLYASPPPVPAGMGPMLPRIPRPPDLPTLLHFLGVGSVVWYAAAVALPFLLWFARRIDWGEQTRGRVIALSAAGLSLLVAATTLVQYVVIYRDPSHRPPLMGYLPVALGQNVLPWIALAGIVAAIEARRRSVQSAMERERLRAQVAEQRLIALTGQLHPHFLFNTLQGISTLIHRDPEAADEMLAKLSDLLRDLLRHRNNVSVSLEDELRYTRTYLEISKLRFGDRLEFTIDVPPDVLRSAVPLFILQPLVENSLAHGIGGQASGGSVAVRARARDGRLYIEVEDDGGGLPRESSLQEGVGLSNTRERLRASFGDHHDFSLDALPGGGTIARMTIPNEPYVPRSNA